MVSYAYQQNQDTNLWQLVISITFIESGYYQHII